MIFYENRALGLMKEEVPFAPIFDLPESLFQKGQYPRRSTVPKLSRILVAELTVSWSVNLQHSSIPSLQDGHLLTEHRI